MADPGVVVRDGSNQYTAPDLDTVIQWRRENRISTAAEVFDAARGWVPIGQLDGTPSVQVHKPSPVRGKVLMGCVSLLIFGIVSLVALVIVTLRARDRSIIEARGAVTAAMKTGDAAFQKLQWAEAAVAYGQVVTIVDGSFGSSDDLRAARERAFSLQALAQLRSGDTRAAERTVRTAMHRNLDPNVFHADLRPLIEPILEEQRRAEAAKALADARSKREPVAAFIEDGDAAFARRDYKVAKGLFSDALDKLEGQSGRQQDKVRAYMGRASALVMLGEHDAAGTDFNHALVMSDGDVAVTAENEQVKSAFYEAKERWIGYKQQARVRQGAGDQPDETEVKVALRSYASDNFNDADIDIIDISDGTPTEEGWRFVVKMRGRNAMGGNIVKVAVVVVKDRTVVAFRE